MIFFFLCTKMIIIDNNSGKFLVYYYNYVRNRTAHLRLLRHCSLVAIALLEALGLTASIDATAMWYTRYTHSAPALIQNATHAIYHIR